MGDLADALREAGHEDVAAALENKELAGRLRQNGRDDLADSLEASDQATQAMAPAPPAPPPHELLAKELRDAQSRWLTLGDSGGPDDEAA